MTMVPGQTSEPTSVAKHVAHWEGEGFDAQPKPCHIPDKGRAIKGLVVCNSLDLARACGGDKTVSP